MNLSRKEKLINKIKYNTILNLIRLIFVAQFYSGQKNTPIKGYF